MWVVKLLNIIPADIFMAQILADNLLNETIDGTCDFSQPLEEHQVTHISVLLASQRICVNMVKY